jgi:succinate dehydrogenase flavin-adding protein (antitoxin of CptAB toxin-antitoxin module)
MQLLKRSIRCFSINIETYAILEKDVTALRNQLLFRSKNLGVRELDLIVGSWARHNIPKYSS